MRSKKGILNFKAYLRGALQKVTHHKQYKTGNLTYSSDRSQQFYDSLNSDRVGKTEVDQQDFSMRLIGNQGVIQKSLSSAELDALGVF